jgi:hypothetical protein
MTTVTMATALVDTALMMYMISFVVMEAAMGVAVTMEVVIDMMMDELGVATMMVAMTCIALMMEDVINMMMEGAIGVVMKVKDVIVAAVPLNHMLCYLAVL